MTNGATRHLVIVGGGHTHLFVLRMLALRPEAGLRLTVVSPAAYATYSGMVPGVVAGQYPLAAAQIDVRALAARAGARFMADRVVRLDAPHRVLELRERPSMSYDLLSIDIGSQPAAMDRVAANAPVTMVKPIEVAAGAIEAAFAFPPPAQGRQVVVVGAGPGGTEIAFALAARLRREGRGSVTICDQATRPVVTRHPRTSALVMRIFAQHGIRFLGGVDVQRVDADGVWLSDRQHLSATSVVWATGAAGPSVFAASGLPTDGRGFLQVGDDLRCVQHPEILAAGDCATLRSHPTLPKAGVHAVRQGPILTANLRALARGAARLRPYRPQREFLALLNTGDGAAILSYGRVAWRGRLAWWLKDRIDRAFIRRYATTASAK